ncbi:hypothetical protein NLJ89_g8363 [Agrocybe chaxingu]|uniref:DUF4470 domain-containing protein n=1 Tax=Agrocybe chaxingu TaxID=84603 RepID=A0A9W8MSU0_9AGAR|nr:hypothetical protein NLJ89_g8363 [Agrocybe chaxingu]
MKICIAAAGDIRNLVELVNSLPDEHTGKLDILLNNSHAVVLNRMLVILCVLLTPGPSIDESAEVAMHLMCSAFLPDSAAAYVRHCVDLIYGKEFNERDMSFQTTLKTRGRGKLYSAQPSASIKKPFELFSSTYGSQKAHRSMQKALQDPFFTDDRDKTLCMLRPAHRLALERFWKTGILAPFSLDTTAFKSPNRLMYTPQGDWIGLSSNVNPLHGWDISAVRRAGLQHGVDPSGDILGALFFHIKSELREFCLRVKEYNINIHLLQYDSRLISKGISIGVLPAFSEAAFDRIDVGDLGDQIGVAECLGDWGPLLNKKNRHASLIMHSKKWHENSPHRIALNNPRASKILMERCQSQPHLVSPPFFHSMIRVLCSCFFIMLRCFPSFRPLNANHYSLLFFSEQKSKLKTFFKNPHSPSVARLMASLDAFVDHEEAFLDYLEAQEAQATAANLGLILREVHSIHPKRVGVPLWAERQILPNLSKDDFYDLFTLGGADLTLRFAEFECSSFLD